MARTKEEIFRFKQFQVINRCAAMKVNTDGVLLGAWCRTGEARHVLDVGTGCGVIALMMAQRNPTARIDAIDIDAGAVDECRVNFAASPWAARLHVRQCDFNDYAPDNRYDLVVSNPPYFNNGILPTGSPRAQARHTLTLTASQLIAHASRMLTPHGTVSIISPVDNRAEIEQAAGGVGLLVRRMTFVSPVVGQPPKRILWELGRGRVGDVQADELAIEVSPMRFTAQYVNLCRDFYLKM